MGLSGPIQVHLCNRLEGWVITALLHMSASHPLLFMSKLQLLYPVDVAGHSLHTGGATALALTGTTNDHIHAADHWSSDTFQVYIYKNPIILHILLNGHHITPTSQLACLSSSLFFPITCSFLKKKQKKKKTKKIQIITKKHKHTDISLCYTMYSSKSLNKMCDDWCTLEH
jgi:hypothetical protein